MRQLIESRAVGDRYRARRALLIIYACWFVALAAGTLVFEGELAGIKPKDLPLATFDWLFRRTGVVLVFAAWAIRAGIKHVLHRAGDGPRDNLWLPAGLYTLQAAGRALLYHLHIAGVIFSPKRWLSAASFPREALHHPPHVMSDHILLAASVIAGLSCEAALLYLSTTRRRRKWSPLMLRACAVLGVGLAVLVSVESYYTARYFHPPAEIVVGAVVGLVVFQAPTLMFIVRALGEHERQNGGVEADTSDKKAS